MHTPNSQQDHKWYDDKRTEYDSHRVTTHTSIKPPGYPHTLTHTGHSTQGPGPEGRASTHAPQPSIIK